MSTGMQLLLVLTLAVGVFSIWLRYGMRLRVYDVSVWGRGDLMIRVEWSMWPGTGFAARPVSYTGSGRVWHRFPDGEPASSEMADFLAETYRRHMWFDANA